MQFVDDVRRAWRWFSVQAMTFLALLPIVWEQLPPETQDLVPPAYRPWAITIVAVAGILGRTIKQAPAK